MSVLWAAIAFVGMFVAGLTAGYLIVRSAFRQTIADLRVQNADQHRWLQRREEREHLAFVSLRENIGVHANPDLGKPRTISRSPRAVARIVQDRKQRERLEREAKEYKPQWAAQLKENDDA